MDSNLRYRFIQIADIVLKNGFEFEWVLRIAFAIDKTQFSLCVKNEHNHLFQKYQTNTRFQFQIMLQACNQNIYETHIRVV